MQKEYYLEDIIKLIRDTPLLLHPCSNQRVKMDFWILSKRLAQSFYLGGYYQRDKVKTVLSVVKKETKNQLNQNIATLGQEDQNEGESL